MAFVIDRFQDEYLFLSNFYEGKVKYRGITFTTAEHAYQCQKIPERLWHKVNAIKKPNYAKRTVKTMLVDPARDFPWDQARWDRNKVDIMREVLQAKFSHPFLLDKLRDTAPAQLIEGNTWKDKFWGVPIDSHGFRTGTGENWLGRLLMEIRDAPRV